MGRIQAAVCLRLGVKCVYGIRLAEGRVQAAVCLRLGVKVCTVLDWLKAESRLQCVLDWV